MFILSNLDRCFMFKGYEKCNQKGGKVCLIEKGNVTLSLLLV